MKRLLLLTVLLALFAFQALPAQSTISRVYNDLEIDIWTDRDDGSNYSEGDEITFYFRASRDCHVVIYDLDTRGNINLMFPIEYDQNNFIKGDVIYSIPGPNEDYDLTVEGPPGTEFVQMVAAIEYFEVPQWRGPVPVYADEWGFDFEDDNDEFIEKINKFKFPRNAAFDQVSFYVAPSYYYQSEKEDCYGDCGMVYVDYPYGCDVYVDGIYWGASPLYIPSIYLGRHRMSVYWGSSIIYNDWIFIDSWSPYYVYTRPHYLYDYFYTNWYHDYYYNDYHHFYGPSKNKYKHSTDYYSHRDPKPRKGYKLVANANFKYYKKSDAYTAKKTNRIKGYKDTYGYSKKTKTYSKVGKIDYGARDALSGKAGWGKGASSGVSSKSKKKNDATVSGKKGSYGNSSTGKGSKSSGVGTSGKKGSNTVSGKQGYQDKNKTTYTKKKQTTKSKSTSGYKKKSNSTKSSGNKAVKKSTPTKKSGKSSSGSVKSKGETKKKDSGTKSKSYKKSSSSKKSSSGSYKKSSSSSKKSSSSAKSGGSSKKSSSSSGSSKGSSGSKSNGKKK